MRSALRENSGISVLLRVCDIFRVYVCVSVYVCVPVNQKPGVVLAAERVMQPKVRVQKSEKQDP